MRIMLVGLTRTLAPQLVSKCNPVKQPLEVAVPVLCTVKDGRVQVPLLDMMPRHCKPL